MVKKEESKSIKKVVVTTAHRGVFFGEVISNDAPKSITLKNAKNCLYWGSSIHGFIGLAVKGPGAGSRVGPVATLPMDLFDITSIIECTAEAIENWEKGVWS